MDIIKFNNPTHPTKMEQAEIINNIRSKLWIERYDVAGEFEFLSKVSSGIKEKLPIGSFISHVDSQEIMIVENHEISDNKEKEPDIKVTGRGFESFFEQRLTGHWEENQIPAPPHQLNISANNPWNQAVTLISSQVISGQGADPGDVISHLIIATDIFEVGEQVPRVFKKEDLYKALTDFLASFKLGIKVVRPGIWSPLGPTNTNVGVIIHKGTDRSDEVVFSYDTGEIESAEYLWSIKKKKNAARIIGKWLETCIFPTETGIERRWITIDASDIDEHYTEQPPVGSAEEITINSQLQKRGYEVLSSHNDLSITKAEISKEAKKVGYRTDFNVGDIITVSGDYNATSKMRVTEYVEIEDENGQKGYPTLSLA